MSKKCVNFNNFVILSIFFNDIFKSMSVSFAFEDKDILNFTIDKGIVYFSTNKNKS